MPTTAGSEQRPLCELRNINQVFTLPQGASRQVLRDIQLEVFPGEVVALLGPSGCGKSTILRILAGLIRPTSGEVLFHNVPLGDCTPPVALVFQSFALLPWLTVAANIRVVLEAAGVPEPEAGARVANVIRLVGLSGFEQAYPREISGGMKQRAGIARALAVEPEILFLDEPFSQVDALTAESLRAELLSIWKTSRRTSSILMVSHDIKEVAFMADRIVLLAAQPGRIRTIVENRLPRPRDYRSSAFAALVDRLHDAITGAEAPHDTLPQDGAGQTLEPLPEVAVSEVIGLLEFLKGRGGRQEIFRIATETHQEFGRVINVIEAAEMLGFAETPSRFVVLSDLGERFLSFDAPRRAALWRERLLQHRTFGRVLELAAESGGHALGVSAVTELLLSSLPFENPERQFETLLRWGRFAGLFRLDDRHQFLEITKENKSDEVCCTAGGASRE